MRNRFPWGIPGESWRKFFIPQAFGKRRDPVAIHGPDCRSLITMHQNHGPLPQAFLSPRPVLARRCIDSIHGITQNPRHGSSGIGPLHSPCTALAVRKTNPVPGVRPTSLLKILACFAGPRHVIFTQAGIPRFLRIPTMDSHQTGDDDRFSTG